MKPSPKIKNIFFRTSAILILLAIVVFYFAPQVAPWLMVVGVAGFGACIFTTPYPGKSMRGRRLFNIQVFAVVLMAIGAYLMLVGRMEWVIVFLISAILTLYATYATSAAWNEEQADKEKQK